MTESKTLYREDMSRYGGNPGNYIRVFHYLYRKAACTSFVPVLLFYKLLFRFWANLRGLEFSANKNIGGGLYIGHPFNITVNGKAVIGRNCNIHKGAVIGQTNRGQKEGVPTIGNQVWIGVNAVVVGKITIGDDVLIAPNSYVNVDVPPHSIVLGNPCVIKHRDNATEGYINNVVE